MHTLLTALLLAGAAGAADPAKAPPPEPAKLDYLCVWSTKVVTHALGDTLSSAKAACAAAPPVKGAILLEVRAPDKNGKHGDILIDGVPIDYE